MKNKKMSEQDFMQMIEETYGFEKADIIIATVDLKDNQDHVLQAAMLASFSEMPLNLGVEDLRRTLIVH